MGCDIHAFVEFVRDVFGDYESLSNETLNIPRDYDLFTVLALGDGGVINQLPYPPRGLPFKLSSAAKEYFYQLAQEVIDFVEECFPPEEGDEPFQPEEYAKEYGPAAHQEFVQNNLLPTPEMHSHSWLNLSELEEVLAYGKLNTNRLSTEFRAVIEAMQELAGSYGAENVRLVFCFDGAS